MNHQSEITNAPFWKLYEINFGEKGNGVQSSMKQNNIKNRINKEPGMYENLFRKNITLFIIYITNVSYFKNKIACVPKQNNNLLKNNLVY